ncbi:MAG: tripartite tricarboxylate transporter substrate binding protein [Alphaproteobacteria bacterium]
MRRVVWVFAFYLAATTAAQAQPYPNKPIRMIVPFPAGSATDGQARLIGTHFQKVFGHGFIVENMPGATGAIASRTVAKAPPDGYTLLLSTVSTHSANYYLYNNLGYDPISDFTPIALIAQGLSAMVVRAETPYRTLKDFVDFAKANPDKLNFAYGNVGSLAGGAMLNAAAGIKTNAVSYRGTPQATTDLLGGQIDFVVMDMSPTQEHIKAGKLRALAVTGSKRAEAFPDVPTMVESGYRDFVLYSWQGVHGPAGMSPEIAASLNQAIKDAVNTPKGKRFFGAYGSETGAMTPAEFSAFVKEELKRWDGIVKVTGLPKQ